MFSQLTRRIVRTLIPDPIPNLLGDRDVENSWIVGNMGTGPGRTLDFGCGYTYLGLIAAYRGFDVTAIDLENIKWPYVHPRLRFIHGDILEMDWEPAQFDLIINCSSIEHVGLTGRYGSSEVSEGDLLAMAKLRTLLKSGGTMLLTVPVGQDAVIAPFHRVYGTNRLPCLLDGFVVRAEEYLHKPDQSNVWQTTTREIACQTKPSVRFYALGMFVLARA